MPCMSLYKATESKQCYCIAISRMQEIGVSVFMQIVHMQMPQQDLGVTPEGVNGLG